MVNLLAWIIVGGVISWVAGMIMQTGDPPIQLPNRGVSRQHIRGRLVPVPVRRD